MHTSVSFLGRWLCLGPKTAPEPFTAGGARALEPHGHRPPEQWHRADAGARPQTLTCHRCPLCVPWAGGTHLTLRRTPGPAHCPTLGSTGVQGKGELPPRSLPAQSRKQVTCSRARLRCVCTCVDLHSHACVQACRGVHMCIRVLACEHVEACWVCAHLCGCVLTCEHGCSHERVQVRRVYACTVWC